MNAKHLQDGVKHECTDCGKTFNRKDNLKQHQSICQTIRFKCPRCHRILRDIASLTQHMGLCPVPTCTVSGAVCGTKSTARTQEDPHQKTQDCFHPRLQDEEETQTKPWRFSLSRVFRLVHHQRGTLSPQTGTPRGPQTLSARGSPFWLGRWKNEQYVAWKCWTDFYPPSLHPSECWFQFSRQPITKARWMDQWNISDFGSGRQHQQWWKLQDQFVHGIYLGESRHSWISIFRATRQQCLLLETSPHWTTILLAGTVFTTGWRIPERLCDSPPRKHNVDPTHDHKYNDSHFLSGHTYGERKASPVHQRS